MTVHYKYVVDGYDTSSGDMKNVFYFNGSGGSGPDPNTLVTDFFGAIQAELSGQFRIQTVTIHQWSGPDSGEWYETIADKKVPKKAPPWGVGVPITLTTLFVGSNAGDRLPPQTAAVLYAKTSVAHVIAKKYISDFCEDTQNAGELNATAQAHLETAGEKWNLVRGAYTPEVWGPIHGFQPIGAALQSRYLGSQRRRKAQVGS